MNPNSHMGLVNHFPVIYKLPADIRTNQIYVQYPQVIVNIPHNMLYINISQLHPIYLI